MARSANANARFMSSPFRQLLRGRATISESPGPGPESIGVEAPERADLLRRERPGHPDRLRDSRGPPHPDEQVIDTDPLEQLGQVRLRDLVIESEHGVGRDDRARPPRRKADAPS